MTVTTSPLEDAMPRLLPPDVSEQDFDLAIAEFQTIVGDKWVISEPAELAQYADPYPVGEGYGQAPSVVVSPADTEQVQAIVRVANAYGIPLMPISMGKNNGYGGASPPWPARRW